VRSPRLPGGRRSSRDDETTIKLGEVPAPIPLALLPLFHQHLNQWANRRTMNHRAAWLLEALQDNISRCNHSCTGFVASGSTSTQHAMRHSMTSPRKLTGRVCMPPGFVCTRADGAHKYDYDWDFPFDTDNYWAGWRRYYDPATEDVETMMQTISHEIVEMITRSHDDGVEASRAGGDRGRAGVVLHRRGHLACADSAIRPAF
jgi:hypothetical protein